MKNFKQIAFGLLLGAMVVGFSAFTNSSKKLKSTPYEFYNISGAIGSTNPSNFIYEGGDDSQCQPGTSTECTAEWNVNNPPSNGDKPSTVGSPRRVTGSGELGVYPGN